MAKVVLPPIIPRASRLLRAFDLLLFVLAVSLVAVTAFSFLIAVSAPHAWSPTIQVTVDPPYNLDLAGDHDVIVDERGGRTYSNGLTPEGGVDPTSLHADVYVARSDLDTRVTLALGLGSAAVLAWLALVNLRRIVHSAQAGDPFDRRNVIRLRIVAACVLGFWVITSITTRLLARTLESAIPVHVSIGGASWLVCLPAGLGLLALAEVFARGTELRDLEKATV